MAEFTLQVRECLPEYAFRNDLLHGCMYEYVPAPRAIEFNRQARQADTGIISEYPVPYCTRMIKQ